MTEKKKARTKTNGINCNCLGNTVYLREEMIKMKFLILIMFLVMLCVPLSAEVSVINQYGEVSKHKLEELKVMGSNGEVNDIKNDVFIKGAE